MKINGKPLDDYIVKIKGARTEIGKFVKMKNIETPTINESEPINPKRKITGYTGQIKSSETLKPDNQTLSLWDILRQKIQSIRPIVEQFKQSLDTSASNKQLELVKYKISEIEEKLEKAKNGEIHLNTKEIIEAEAQLERLNNQKTRIENEGKANIFSRWINGTTQVSSRLNGISGIAIRIKNQIKQIGSSFNKGLGHILKYAGALLSIRGVYSLLRGSAQAWLSSQNAGAQQLSANINYMKYAMGSALAPVIQFVTNLVYQLMKAIQMVAYALTGVNIFAKATASSMNSVAGGAKKAKEETKQLAGVHSEINNIQDKNSNSGSGSGSVSPSMDLSQMDKTPNSIIDAIKNGDWYLVGATIGEKINEAMDKIPWDKIHNTARKIGTNIAQFLNGVIETTNWSKVGNTIAQGLNTAIYFTQSFVHKFNWHSFGKSVADTLNGVFKNTNWRALGDTISTGIKGALDSISSFASEVNLKEIIVSIESFVFNLDFEGMHESFYKALGSITGALAKAIKDYAKDKVKEIFKKFITFSEDEEGNATISYENIGKNIAEGLFKGILNPFGAIRQWIYNHVFEPFIDGFKEAFEINSPSKVMEELGKFIIEGLLNGITSLVYKVKEKWQELKDNAKNKLTEIRDTVTNKISETKTNFTNKLTEMKNNASNSWNNIKSTIANKVTEIKDGITNKFRDAYNNIRNTFSNIGSFFSGIWRKCKKYIFKFRYKHRKCYFKFCKKWHKWCYLNDRKHN